MGMNYTAVAVVSIGVFLLGWLWYSPVLFAKRWMGYLGKTPEELSGGASPLMFLWAVIANFFQVYVLARVLSYVNTDAPLRGAAIGAMLAIGFTAATSFNGQVNFLRKPVGLWLIDSGYIVIGSMFAGAMLTVWR